MGSVVALVVPASGSPGWAAAGHLNDGGAVWGGCYSGRSNDTARAVANYAGLLQLFE